MAKKADLSDKAKALLAKAEELGVLVCQVPIEYGPHKGESAQATLTGFNRHRIVGHLAPDIDEECKTFRAAYVREWSKGQKEKKADRQVLAQLGDGAEVVRYQRAGKLFIEKGDDRQLVLLDDAIKAVASDPEAEHFAGRPGGTIFDRKLAKAIEVGV